MIFAIVLVIVALRVVYCIAEACFERDWPRSTWRGLVTALGLVLLCASAFGQTAVRVDQPILTSGPNVPSSGGPLPQALWVANATVAICTHPTTLPNTVSATLAECQANPITTYTDSTEGTICPLTSPLVLLPGTTCSASAGAEADLGFWFGGGLADYWVISAYGSYGPYTVSGGGSGGGGGGSTNFVSGIPVGAINGTNTVFTLPTAACVANSVLVWNNYPLVPVIGWTLSGTTITYPAAPQVGDNLYFQCATQTSGGGGSAAVSCSNYSSIEACVTANATTTGAPASAIAVNAGLTGTWFQPVSQTAGVSCTSDPTTGQLTFFATSPGSGYTTSTIPITISNIIAPGSPSIGTVTGNIVAGGLNSFTITGANSGWGAPGFASSCPLTATAQAPPAAVTPISVARLNAGVQGYSPLINADDFGCAGDGVTDDTLCLNFALQYAFTHPGSSGFGELDLGAEKVYYSGQSTATHQGAFHTGAVPVAAVAVCSAPGGVVSSCTISTGGYNLATAPLNLAPLGTGYVTAGNVTATSSNGGAVGPFAVNISAVSGGIVYANVANGGTSGSVAGDILTVTQGGASGGLLKVLTVSGGVIQTVAVGGSGATITPTLTACSSGPCPNNVGGKYVSAIAASGGTGYPTSFTIYLGQTCGYTPCAFTSPMNNQIGINIVVPNSVTIHGNNATINCGYTGSYVTAANYNLNWPYTDCLGSVNGSGTNHVKIDNLNVSNAFIALGNVGAYTETEKFTCIGCAVDYMGQNVQFFKGLDTGYKTQSSSCSLGAFGGLFVDRAPLTGINSSTLQNVYNLVDGITLDRSIHFACGGSSNAAIIAQRRAIDCWYENYWYRPYDYGITDAQNCNANPNYVPVVTDQDQALLSAQGLLFHGVAGNTVNLYGVFGRPMLSINIHDLQIKQTSGYGVIMGPQEGSSLVDIVGTEANSTCNGTNGQFFGAANCPNPYEPNSLRVPAVILQTNGSTRFDNLTANAAFTSNVSYPTNKSINAAGAASPYKQGFVYANNSLINWNGADGGIAAPQGATNYALINDSPPPVTQQNGGAIQSNGGFISLGMRKYSGGTLMNSNWFLQTKDALFGPTSTPSVNQPPTILEFQAWLGNTSANNITSAFVKMPGLQVRSALLHNGEVTSITPVNLGLGYLPFKAVPCTVAASIVQIATTGKFYQADCSADANAFGAISDIHCILCGQQYTSAPTVTINPPVFYSQITGYSATTTVVTINTVTTPQNTGDSVTVQGGFANAFGQALVTATATTPLVVTAINPGVSFTANYSSAGIGATSDVGVGIYPNDNGTTATAVATIGAVAPLGYIEDHASCAALLNAGGTVPAGAVMKLAGITCTGSIWGNTLQSFGDFLTPLSMGGTSGNQFQGMQVSAYTTAANTITIVMDNSKQTSPVTYTAGTTGNPWEFELVSANLNGDALNFSTIVSAPTITTSYPEAITASLTTTAAATDTITLTGMTSTGHCAAPGPTNSSALAATIAGVTTKATNSVTVTHAVTSGMTYDIVCWSY